MALPAGFLDELRARTPLAALVGRRVRLIRSGRNSRGCCPFHNEKTPSFYVYDDGFHCFGCGAHGDAISFVMQTQGLGFPDAVAALAAEAGLEVPQPSQAQAAAERRRLDQYAVLEAAQRGFRRRLTQAGGAAARDYLARRGLSEATVAAWGLGWSGPGRGDLADELAAETITPAMMAEAGLMRLDEDERPAGELFFNRLMFPIRDARGRIVAFGGRVLGDGQPKYLNGPETDLFAKRRSLYGLDLATLASRNDRKVAVVEGYMDVIALHQIGVCAVAPLGTALTADQLDLVWRLSPVPVLCFDGDSAGGRAAARSMELALPLVTPERSLAVARLPDGEDPDSLARRDPAGLRAALDGAQSLVPALYDLIREQTGEATPEARARLRQRLEAAAAGIGDRALAREVRSDLLGAFFAARRSPRPGGGEPARTQQARPVPRQPPDRDRADAARWDILLGLALLRPALLHDVHEALALLHPPPACAGLHAAILDLPASFQAETPLDTDDLMNHLRNLGLAERAAQALRSVARLLPASVSQEAYPAEVEATWWHFFGLMDPTRLDDDIRDAQIRLGTSTDAESLRRLVTLVKARGALVRGDVGQDDE